MGEERDRPVDDVPDVQANGASDTVETEIDLAESESDLAETEDGPAEPEQRPPLDRGRYISTRDAADLLGVNRATVINWARQGKFGGFQYGPRGIYRFDRQELLEFIDRSRIPYPQGADDLSGDDAGL